MSIATSARSAALYIVLGFAFAAFALLALPAEGADHKDGPGATSDAKADIADIYGFRSPENNDNFVVVVTLAGLTPPADINAMAPDPAVSTSVFVDRNGDLTPEATVNVGVQGSNFTISGLGANPITGPITPLNSDQPMVTTAGPIKAFAGVRDDPFFFDLAGFNAFLQNPQRPAAGLRPAGQTPSDSAAGTNALAVVIELPITALTGAQASNTGTIKVWGTSQRGQTRVDRVAVPGVNSLLIPADQKNAFNAGNPSNDVQAFGGTLTTVLNTLRGAVTNAIGAETGGPLGNMPSADVATKILVPYVVTIDFSQPVQFPNGRRLQDDVADIALGVVLNRGGAAGISDAVNANDKQFLTAFPFLAAPHRAAAAAQATPAAGGAATMTPPRTGTGGFAQESNPWQLPLLGMAAMFLVLGGGVMARRRMSR